MTEKDKITKEQVEIWQKAADELSAILADFPEDSPEE